MNFLVRILTLYLVTIAAASAAEPAVIIRLSQVYSESASTSKVVGQINAGAKVNLLERKGGWKLVVSDEKSITGWVRGYQVRETVTPPSSEIKTEGDSGGFFSGLKSLSRMTTGLFGSSNEATSSGTATIGVRGLSESEINSATPDFKELEKMKRFTSSASRMPAFTAEGELVARKVAYFEEQ